MVCIFYYKGFVIEGGVCVFCFRRSFKIFSSRRVFNFILDFFGFVDLVIWYIGFCILMGRVFFLFIN